MLIKQIKIRLISKFHKFISFIINFIIAQALALVSFFLKCLGTNRIGRALTWLPVSVRCGTLKLSKTNIKLQLGLLVGSDLKSFELENNALITRNCKLAINEVNIEGLLGLEIELD